MFGNKKGQSAMEYLMTYGWAILIIAIVLAALFSLGVFSSTSFTGTTCVASSGYLCSNPILHGGAFGATIGQATGTSWTATILCFVPSSATPPASGATSCPTGTGTGSYTVTNGLASGQSVQASFALSGISNTAGTVVTGSVWALYATSGSTPTYSTQIATATLKEV
ncbi:MAG: hypothetical protein M1360_02625 [Candidatus Marsarchaeota archaeon]|jgi:hypothetical protein|nr:hypothetical protein [Candidatus Marsarchaeota archaeon]MCL5418812.1 hypothetical protein [Candidatus Marsarchaeota archaeon]